MPLFQKKTPEQEAQEAATKASERQHEEERRQAVQAEEQWRAFLGTPAGRARMAFERGDHVFQCSVDVMSTSFDSATHLQAAKDAFTQRGGRATPRYTNDPVAILNSVSVEGWELINGGFVFVPETQAAVPLSGGGVQSVRGRTVGFYLFKRCEKNRRDWRSPNT